MPVKKTNAMQRFFLSSSSTKTTKASQRALANTRSAVIGVPVSDAPPTSPKTSHTVAEYANGDVYAGDVAKDGSRSGQGRYVFKQAIKISVTRADKAVLDAPGHRWSDNTSLAKGEIVRTGPHVEPDVQGKSKVKGAFHRPIYSDPRHPHTPTFYEHEGRARYASELGVQTVAHHRPVEEFQVAEIKGEWSHDGLKEGTVVALNREGSIKRFTVSGEDLNLLAAPVAGQSLTLRTFEGDDSARPIKVSPR